MNYLKYKNSAVVSTRYHNFLGFTLVELIVVVTILAILATIGFVSYSSYLTGVRDTNRLAQLVSIHDGLELYRTKNDLPLPDDNVEIQTNGVVIDYQGYVGSNVLETIDFTKGGKDPKDDTYFSYILTKDRKYFQLLAFLEEEENITAHINLTNTTSAVDYTDRIPTVYGKKLGILTDVYNTPIQEIPAIITAGFLNLTIATTGYTGHMTDTETLSGASLLSINQHASCKRIRHMRGGSQNGAYDINPTGADGAEFEVYCDMVTAGGGWTIATMHADTTTQNTFDTGTSNTLVPLEIEVSTKGIITDIWKAELTKDLMLKCYTDDDDFQTFTKPFVIYDYQFSDIGNLTKLAKAGTAFSSSNLIGEYDNKTVYVGANYATATSSQSLYVQGSFTSHAAVTRFFTLTDGTYRMFTSSSPGEAGSPAIGTGGGKDLDSSNYCITAIR